MGNILFDEEFNTGNKQLAVRYRVGIKDEA